MVSSFISRLVILVFGTLYPAYASYKAVRTKNVKEYVKWMMYWIVFALFTCAETFTDLFLSFWFPFYYELKIITVIYLLSPATKGSSLLYRKFVHPVLIQREQEIDEYIAKAKEQGYHTVLSLGSKGVSYATSLIMHTAIKGGGGLVNQLKKSYSLGDLNEEEHIRNQKRLGDQVDGQYSEDPRFVRRNPFHNPQRSFSTGSPNDMYFPEVDVYQRPGEYLYSSGAPSAEEISSGYSSGDVYHPPGNLPKGDLVRTASLGPSSRLRTRSGAKNGLPKRSSVSEGGSTFSAVEPLESQIQTDNYFRYPLTHSPFSFPFFPFIRPEYHYMFENLPPNQFLTFMSHSPSMNENFEKVLKNEGAVISEINSNSEGQTLETKQVPILDPGLTDAKESVNEEKTETQIIDQKDIAVHDITKDSKRESETLKKISTNEGLQKTKKYNKRLAPAPPSADDSGCTSDNEAEFCTPNASPKSERKYLTEISAENRNDENLIKAQNLLTVPQKPKGKKGGISKRLHMPKMSFSFWHQKGGKHSSESESSSIASSENVSAKVDDSNNLEVFIPLRGGEDGSQESDLKAETE